MIVTIASDVKNCMASLTGAKNNFSHLAIVSRDDDAKRIFHECMMETEEIIQDLQNRVYVLDREEPQYKG